MLYYSLLPLILLIVWYGFHVYSRRKLLIKYLKQPAYLAFIPIYSDYKISIFTNCKKSGLVGMLCRIIGIIGIIGVLLWQMYSMLVLMTHIFGIMANTYTQPSQLPQQIALYAFIGIWIIGIAARLLTAKRLNKYFGRNRTILDFIGMISPTVQFTVLALSRKTVFIMDKDIEDMSNEEFRIYCALTDDK